MKLIIASLLLSLFFLLPQALAAIPTITDPAPQKIPHWGFILYQDICAYNYNSGYYDTYWNPYPDTPLTTDFYIFGFGRHEVRSERHYDVYTYDWTTGPTVNFSKIIHFNYSGTYTEKLYLFNFLLQPHVHPRTSKTIIQGPFPVMINGTMHSQMFIDDRLVWEDTVIVTDPHYENPYVCNERPVNGLYISQLQPRCCIGVTFVNYSPKNMSAQSAKPVDIFWYENSTGSWVLRQMNRNVESHGFDQACSWDYLQANQYDTTYWWKVSVDDGTKNVTQIYHFTTRKKSFWEIPLGPSHSSLHIFDTCGINIVQQTKYEDISNINFFNWNN
jgi:hypothetical protein